MHPVIGSSHHRRLIRHGCTHYPCKTAAAAFELKQSQKRSIYRAGPKDSSCSRLRHPCLPSSTPRPPATVAPAAHPNGPVSSSITPTSPSSTWPVAASMHTKHWCAAPPDARVGLGQALRVRCQVRGHKAQAPWLIRKDLPDRWSVSLGAQNLVYRGLSLRVRDPSYGSFGLPDSGP
jgi:hypothetical protein